jgi:DNA polymerase III subunit gamma/tau
MELLMTQAKRTDSDAVLRVIDALAAAEGRLRYALSKRVFFEIALVKAVKARDMVGIDGLLKKLNELKSGVLTNPVASEIAPARDVAPVRVAPVAPAPPTRIREATPVTSPASLDEAWAYAIDHLGKVTPLAKSYLVGTRVFGLKGNVLVVRFDPEFADRKEFASHARNIEILQNSLKEKLRMDVALKFEVGETSTAPAARATAVAPAKAGAPVRVGEPAKMNVDDFKNDPLIKKALEIFKGTIVEVRK